MHPTQGLEVEPSPTLLLLGPPGIRRPAGFQVLPGRLQITLFAMLALRPGSPVDADRLLDALWNECRPTDVLNALHSQVSRLRQFLGGPPVVFGAGTYELAVPPETVDVHVFEQLVAESGRLLAGGAHVLARQTSDRALSLWRGTPFAELGDVEFVERETARLDELRLQALITRLEADLALRQHGTAVISLRHLTAAYPMREDLWALLVLALYRSGRSGEALAAYRTARATLVHELGLEPGPLLRGLEAGILRQDPELAAPPHPCAAHALLFSSVGGPLRRLPLPPEVEGYEPPLAWDSYPSVQLFLDRARTNSPDFDPDTGEASDIVTLCRLLDGDPVAIELAAGQVPWLSMSRLVELHRRVPLCQARL